VLYLILLIVVVETCATIATFMVVVGVIVAVTVVILILLAFVRIRSSLVIGIVRVFPFSYDWLILILGNSFLHHIFQ